MGKIAVLFAGQGAQYEGMAKDLLACSDKARAVFTMADGIRPGTADQCTTAGKEELSETVNTQPCLFCADLAAAEALREHGVHFDMAAGFSLGEIPALAFTGHLRADEAFRFVVHRGILMDEAAKRTGGGMLAVLKLSAEQVEAICASVPLCYAVNYNCPGQTVVSCGGDMEALEAAVKAVGGRGVRLAVSGAFHSPMMDSAAAALRSKFASLAFSAPTMPLYANVTAAPYGADTDLLFRQVNSPVLWQKTIENMAADGADTFVEVGPGKTLSGLVKKILPAAKVLSVADEAGILAALEEL